MRLQIAQLKQQLFPAEWRTRCLTVLDQADTLFSDEICWTEIKEKVRRGILLTMGEKASRVAETDTKAARLVLDLIARLCEGEVSSGWNHTYRGVLSFRGQSYRNIVELALQELHDADWLDYQELEERLEQIDEAVKAAG